MDLRIAVVGAFTAERTLTETDRADIVQAVVDGLDSGSNLDVSTRYFGGVYFLGVELEAEAVIAHLAPDDEFWARVPAYPGCFSQGDTEDEARRNITSALRSVAAVLVDRLACAAVPDAGLRCPDGVGWRDNADGTALDLLADRVS